MKKSVFALVLVILISACLGLSSCKVQINVGSESDTSKPRSAESQASAVSDPVSDQVSEPVSDAVSEPAKTVTVIESYREEEPLPEYSEYTRVYSVPALDSETENALAFNDRIDKFCKGEIDSVRKPENDNLILEIGFESTVENGVAAIMVRYSYMGAYSDYGWTGIELFYFDVENDSEITDWKAYLRKLGYDPDAFTAAFMNTEKIVELATPTEDFMASDIKVLGALVGETETVVAYSYHYENMLGSRTTGAYETFSNSELGL